VKVSQEELDRRVEKMMLSVELRQAPNGPWVGSAPSDRRHLTSCETKEAAISAIRKRVVSFAKYHAEKMERIVKRHCRRTLPNYGLLDRR